jgi:hypothetical protein
MKDSQIVEFYERVRSDGTLGSVFYSGGVNDAAEFYRAVIRQDSLFWSVMLGNEPCGFFWLDSRIYKRAHFHFAVFKEFWNQSEVIGKAVLKLVFECKLQDGSQAIEMIWGVIPEWNVHAIEYVKRCGAQQLCIVPKWAWDQKRNECVDGVMLVYCGG